MESRGEKGGGERKSQFVPAHFTDFVPSPALSTSTKPSFLLLFSNSSMGSFTVDQRRCYEAAAYIFSSLSKKSGQLVTEQILLK